MPGVLVMMGGGKEVVHGQMEQGSTGRMARTGWNRAGWHGQDDTYRMARAGHQEQDGTGQDGTFRVTLSGWHGQDGTRQDGTGQQAQGSTALGTRLQPSEGADEGAQGERARGR